MFLIEYFFPFLKFRYFFVGVKHYGIFLVFFPFVFGQELGNIDPVIRKINYFRTEFEPRLGFFKFNEPKQLSLSFEIFSQAELELNC